MLSYSYAFFFRIGQLIISLLFLFTLLEWFILFRVAAFLDGRREVFGRLSLGDDQYVKYVIYNHSNIELLTEIVDELPYQLQERNMQVLKFLKPQSKQKFDLKIRPTVRGLYMFGHLHIYFSTRWLQLLQRRVSIDRREEVKVIPSIIQMKRYELEVFSHTALLSGIRRVRTIGEDDEFEHIRAFQQGDNIRSMNWKATSRKHVPMVNQFQNTRSQIVYCIVDKGRSMKMPFAGLSLLDHAINASLVISNIVLKKYDRIGLITFSDKIGQIVGAENTPQQLGLIAQQLYNQSTGYKESNYELLFYTLRQRIRRRSIMLFFTNFEHLYDLERNLEFFRALNRRHLLVIIFFINTELSETSEMQTESISDIYLKTTAKKTLIEKELILNTLKVNGIQSILTRPEDLSIEVISKYLEIKAKRMR
ncbi:MAG: DUF58 domain-containing protein [Saprospiraceae bacterium]|nr:DUF58 domain-containing protein [Saprospiraceae bacterium]